MSWVKINHFHWHVVDSQSFALVVPGFEEISSKGAYSPTDVYTPQDVKNIVQYAAAVCRLAIIWLFFLSYLTTYPILAWDRRYGRN
jgi:hypothetical protein